MCGLAGFSLRDSSYQSFDWLTEACAALKHRGPDDFGTLQIAEHGVGLAHTRLSILDPSSSGHQPMITPDGRIVLVFNGEIYNFRELRSELQSQGVCFRGSSDSEVLLSLYQSERKRNPLLNATLFARNFLNRLNGIFSFALWDNDSQSLLLSRDALGVKPLYFQESEEGVYFSSEIKALPLRSLTLDAASLDRYLTFLWNPGEGTPASQIRKLAPGHALVISGGHIQEQFCWYRSPVYRLSSTPGYMSSNQVIRGTEEHLRQAVHRQLVADVPVGAFLSGGLDSSSVVALAREHIPDLRCFTIDVGATVDQGFTEDLPYARRVAQHLGVQLDVVQVDAARMAEDLKSMVWQLDEPLADPASLNVLYISRLARTHGIKVLLSGAGGDDLFTGYRRHLAFQSERYWTWLPLVVRKQLRQLTRQLPATHPLFRRLRKVFSGANLDSDARLVNYFRWIDRSDLQALYAPDFRAALGQVQPDNPMLSFLASLPIDTLPIERMLALEQRFFLADHNLLYTDKMSMAAGIEVRVPFLDLDLVEFASSIPSRYKQRFGESKWVLKKAMEPYLPNDVIYRPKSGFGVPLRRWLRFELRDWIEDTLSHHRLISRGLFDPRAVHRLIEANASGEVDASFTLLSLACIEIWCQLFLDRPLHNPSNCPVL